MTKTTNKSSRRRSVSAVLRRLKFGDRIFRSLPYIGFVTLLGMGLVYNAYQAQKTLRAIEATRAELQELRWKASAVQSQTTAQYKQSALLKRMKKRRLGLVGSTPQVIIADD